MIEEELTPPEVGDVDDDVTVELVMDEDRNEDLTDDEARRAARPYVDWSRYQNDD